MSDGPVFELRGVGRRYGETTALEGVDLAVEPGERIGLIGPSGAGKTTLLSLLNATRSPTSGRLLIFGQDPTELAPERRRRLQSRIGTIHQQFHLVDGLRVIHNVNAGRLAEWSLLRSLWSLIRPRETDRARRILERVGIGEKLYERTGDLSGGEKQRVALSRVLAQDPDVILADEPIASLDRENSREVMDLLSRLAREEGVTAVISLHEYEYALSHCERVIGLRGGRVLFDRPAGEVSEELIDRLYRLER
ncbi:MAG: phosphonate ABC transporter ATP-binding protein [Candidatus Palauibacterales bacterium]|nr:phosphonate ABC transporter ATP-binding protein [Candidatus Palauibacterales bacterium]